MNGKKHFILSSLACLLSLGGAPAHAREVKANLPLSMRSASDIRDNEIFTGKQVKDLMTTAKLGHVLWTINGGLLGGIGGTGLTYCVMDKDVKKLAAKNGSLQQRLDDLNQQLDNEKNKHQDPATPAGDAQKDEKIEKLKKEIKELKSENQTLKNDDSKSKKISELEEKNKEIKEKYEAENKKVKGLGYFLYHVSGISNYECEQFVRKSNDKYKGDKDIQRLINTLKMFKIYSTYASKALREWYMEPTGDCLLAVDCHHLQNALTWNAGLGDCAPDPWWDPQTKDLWDAPDKVHK